jgi:ribosomal protein S6--L-glutamate ligase
LRIAILMQRYSPAKRSHMPDLVSLLAERGAKVEVIHPAEGVVDLSAIRVEHDLYVLKEKSELGLSLAGALHAAGAAILNSYPVSIMLRDKIVTSRLLQAGGVPTPETYVAAHPLELAPLLDAGPLVVKPYRGSRGVGVRVVHTPAELGEAPDEAGPVFAQRYLAHEGRDRKLYAIGAELFGVKRVWPATTHEEKLGEALTVSGELADVMERCRRALGIDLFGADVVECGGRPYVVDASSFPGFKGVPDAPLRLATHIYSVAERAARGEPIELRAWPAAGAASAYHKVRGSALQLVLNALSSTPATAAELDEISRLLNEMKKDRGMTA